MKKILFLMLFSALVATSGKSQCLSGPSPTSNNLYNICAIFQKLYQL